MIYYFLVKNVNFFSFDGRISRANYWWIYLFYSLGFIGYYFLLLTFAEYFFGFGYDFNTPIGGIEQNCNYEESWINFYKTKRLQMVYDLINRKNPMPSNINSGIEKIINKLLD